MSSDVLIDLPDAPSPHSTTSDDADAVNTESARVYFGPLQSPERKYASASRVKTPVRRSNRLSSTRIRERSHADGRLRHPTPTRLNMPERGGSSGDEDMLQDEPSVILASKVLHAHDNPSPPPSPTPDHDAPLPNTETVVAVSDTDEHMEDPTPDAAPSSPAPQLGEAEANTSQPDLINFDSFSTPTATPRASTPLLLPPRSSASAPHDNNATTVDDLLSLSPPGGSVAPETRLTVVPATATADILTPNTEEELQVLDALTTTLPAVLTSKSDDEPQVANASTDALPAPDVPRPLAEEVLVQIVTPEAAPSTTVEDVSPLPPPQFQTPVRRSPRKRSSVSPTRPPANTHVLPALSDLAPDRWDPPTSQIPSAVFPSLGVRVRKRAGSQDVSPNPGAIPSVPVDVERLLDERRPVSPGREARRKWEAEQPRRLGSLSPTSTDLLMQLLPSGTSRTEQQATSMEIVPPATTNDLTSSISTVAEPPSIRASTLQPNNEIPRSQATVGSPSPAPAVFTEPPRTPARRVPIQEAIAQGVYSPSKQSATSLPGKAGPSVGALRLPRQAIDDPKRSPAKRVPISQASASTLPSPNKGKAPMRLASPTRPLAKERARSSSVESSSRPTGPARSRSAEPTRPPLATNVFAKPASASTISSTPKSNTGTPLPYPLAPSTSRAHPPIPEVDEGEAESRTTQRDYAQLSSPPPSSPAKYVSSLRQPSSNVTSRIPRIGAKPYARPKSKEPSPTPTPAAPPKPPIVPRRATGAANGSTRPFRALQAQGSGSSTDGSPRFGPPGSPSNPVTHASVQHNPVADGARVSILKRKREGEKSQASPPGAKPFVLIRKVVPSTLAQPSKASSSATPPAAEASPQKPKGPIRMRKVADWKPPPREPKATITKPTTPPPAVAGEAMASPQAVRQSSPNSALSPSPVPSLSMQPSSANPVAQSTPVPLTPAASGTDPVAPTSHTEPTPGASADSGHETRSNGTRRSSRSRRTVTSQATDVFGAINPAPVRPLNVRRQRTLPTDTSAFAGMTATALRALTSTNTQRNQQQIVSLKTEVIHKEGKRPGSPTTKVRTILEKQRELKVQQRQERAERRARRSSEGLHAGESQADVSADLEDVGNVTVDEDGVPVRHRRGPGDEEDYETPPRPDRPFKRERLDHDVETKEDKRVKWDRGLATAVYIDEITLNPKKPISSDAVKKGCLAPTSKTLRLDTLGNVLEANVPVPNLVRENVVVKKFVYEDDEDAQPAPPPPETIAPLEIKPKSKSKRSKS